MARNAGHFPHFLTIDLRNQTGWLGREDSNLRMAESKSDYSARNINAHFEKTAEYGLNSINRLTLPSKCSPLSCCLESSTRSKLADQIPDTQIGLDYECSIPASTDNECCRIFNVHECWANVRFRGQADIEI
jgi:hypothetical protein